MGQTTHPITGKTKDNKVWAKEIGLTEAGFCYRLGHMSLEKVFSTPVQIQKPRKAGQKRKTKVVIPADLKAQPNEMLTPQPSRWGEVLATLFVFIAGFGAGIILEHLTHRFF